jgi:hypothetical protein
MKMQVYTLWYTRRNGEVRGPFPRAVIAQYLLLNRLRKEDEVSIDQKQWQPIAAVEELVPSVMRADLTDSSVQRTLELARRGADERLAIDRRQQGDGEHDGLRSGIERRAAEPDEVLEHRKAKTEMLVAGRTAQPTNTLLAVVIVLVIAGILVALALNYSPQPSAPDVDCAAAPAAGVNWSNCSLQGGRFDQATLQQALIRNADLSSSSLFSADLQGADLAFSNLSLANLANANLHGALLTGTKLNSSDLSGADLSGADLAYADLSGANLSGANLAGAKLDQAVWIDKTICARGSVGQCLAGR